MKKSPNNDIKPNSWAKALFGWRSLFVGLAGLLLISVAVSVSPSYNFVYNRLLLSNWSFIREHPDLSTAERYASRLGFTYAFVDYMAKNSPESAILLFPKKEYIREKGSQEIRDEMTHKVWLTSFLYPRKVVFEDERGQNPLVEQADYVVIVNGKGYDLLSYDVQNRVEYGICPKNRK